MSTKEIAAALLEPVDEDPKAPKKRQLQPEAISKCSKVWKQYACGPRCTSDPPGEMGLLISSMRSVDNSSVDEALAGHATRVETIIHFDNSITSPSPMTAAAFLSTR